MAGNGIIIAMFITIYDRERIYSIAYETLIFACTDMEAIAPNSPSNISCESPSSMEDFILLMNPDAEQRKRMRPDTDLPKWFGYPIIRSGYRVHFSRSTKEIRSILAKNRSIRPLVLVFNVSLLEFLVVQALRRKCRVVSLFQWVALETLPPLKRFIYRSILSASEQILVYSRIQQDYVRRRFPRAEVRWMGLYTDTVFFQPQMKAAPRPVPGPFLLVPGNHKRDEKLIVEVAETLQMPIVRFSSAPAVIREYSARQSPHVKFLANLSFERIRSLYQQAAAVLNIADDSEWPVGVTTFCEALAMNARIITPSGHSASGYEFEDGTKPYLNVSDPTKSSHWCEATRALLQAQTDFPVNRTPRNLAEKLCSLEAVVRSWSSLSVSPRVL
jgi:hypothetical protein